MKEERIVDILGFLGVLLILVAYSYSRTAFWAAITFTLFELLEMREALRERRREITN